MPILISASVTRSCAAIAGPQGKVIGKGWCTTVAIYFDFSQSGNTTLIAP